MYKDTLQNLESIREKTQELKSRFEPIKLAFVTEKDKIDSTTNLSIVQRNELRESNKKNYQLSREKMVQNIKYEAIALHKRACELIFDQEFVLGDNTKKVWNMIPFDVQIL